MCLKQGHEKTYQSFVSQLEEAVFQMLPPSEETDILLKQLTWENANALYQDLIRPIRKTKMVQNYVKACIDASPAILQGMACAAPMKGQKFSAHVKQIYDGGEKETSMPTCFKCGEVGHMQRQYPRNNKRDSSKKGASPGICPPCQKGMHGKK